MGLSYKTASRRARGDTTKSQPTPPPETRTRKETVPSTQKSPAETGFLGGDACRHIKKDKFLSSGAGLADPDDGFGVPR